METDNKLDIGDVKLQHVDFTKEEQLADWDSIDASDKNSKEEHQNVETQINESNNDRTERPAKTTKKKHHCDQCNFKTKHKKDLKIHLAKHKEPMETRHCPYCNFKTKYKSALTGHLKTHPDPNSKKVFTCDSCDFVTNFHLDYKKHMLIHKEVKWVKCEICDYQTRFERNLKGHMLRHKSSSEVDVFKCEICGYQTKNESMIKQHVNVHNLVEKQSFRSAIIAPHVFDKGKDTLEKS